MIMRRFLWKVLCLLLCIPLLGSMSQNPTEPLPQDSRSLTAQAFYQSGVRLFQANKIEEAAAAFRQAIKASSRFARAYNLLGVCYSRMGKADLAQKAFQEAVDSDPRSAEAHNNLGASYLALHKPDLAAKQFQEAVALSPKDPSPLFNLGRTRLFMKEPNKALAALTSAQALTPHDMRIPLAVGEAYFMAGQTEKAHTVLAAICSAREGASDFQIAAAVTFFHYRHPADGEECLLHAAVMDPSAEEKIVGLASRLLDQRDYQTALAILHPLKSKMEKSPTYDDLIGFAYARVGQPKPAVEAFQKALQLDPRNENYYLDLGQVLGEYDAHGEAIELFEWGIAAHPNSARLYVGLALAYANGKRLKEAREAAEKAKRLDPTLEEAYAALAIICEGEKDWPTLLKNALQLEKLNPGNYRGWYYHAVATMEIQQGGNSASIPQILAWLERAIELEPTFPLAHFQLGKLYLQQKDYSKSIAELKRAIELEPDYLQAHFLLATAYRRVGDIQRSQEQLEIHKKLTANVRSPQHPPPDLKIEKPY